MREHGHIETYEDLLNEFKEFPRFFRIEAEADNGAIVKYYRLSNGVHAIHNGWVMLPEIVKAAFESETTAVDANNYIAKMLVLANGEDA